MMEPALPQEYWDNFWKRHPLRYQDDEVIYRELFDYHLGYMREDPQHRRCLEIGCYPGGFLIYLAKHFGLLPCGMDVTPQLLTHMPAFLRQQGIEPHELLQEDFFTFNPATPYDVVCSFGFVEHFVDFRAVVNRHVDLVAPGGLVMIGAPNFRNIQWLLHRVLDKPNLDRHVIEAMDLSAWREVLEQRGMDVLFSGYYMLFDFYWDSPGSRLKNIVRIAIQKLGRLFCHRNVAPNRYTSPYMLIIARMPTGREDGLPAVGV